MTSIKYLFIYYISNLFLCPSQSVTKEMEKFLVGVVQSSTAAVSSSRLFIFSPELNMENANKAIGLFIIIDLQCCIALRTYHWRRHSFILFFIGRCFHKSRFKCFMYQPLQLELECLQISVYNGCFPLWKQIQSFFLLTKQSTSYTFKCLIREGVIQKTSVT